MSNIDLETLNDLADVMAPVPELSADQLREELAPLAQELFDLKVEKDNAKAEIERLEDQLLKPIEQKINQKKSQIMALWGPSIQGTSQSKLKLGDINLTSKETMNVSIECKDEVINWMLTNEYKDVLAWDINTNKAKAILREEAEKNGIEVSGVKYSRFTLIDVK